MANKKQGMGNITELKYILLAIAFLSPALIISMICLDMITGLYIIKGKIEKVLNVLLYSIPVICLLILLCLKIFRGIK